MIYVCVSHVFFRKRDLLYILLCHGPFSGNNIPQWRRPAKTTDETAELIGIRSKFTFTFSHRESPQGQDRGTQFCGS